MVKNNGSHGQEAEEFRLGEESWEALILAASDIEEMLLEDLKQLRTGAPITETNLAGLMPRRFIPRYDEAFADRLAKTSLDLTERLERAQKDGWAYPHATFLNLHAARGFDQHMIRIGICRHFSYLLANGLD